MAKEVILSAPIRQNLLSLQGTKDLVDRTQGRLASGLKVESVLDDPVAFFGSKALEDRADDFNERKGKIDQGISTVQAALDGLDRIENVVRQLKGLMESMKSASGSQLGSLVSQYNQIRTQVGYLASDASYNGVNLLNSTNVTLDVSFSTKTQSKIEIGSFDARETAIGIHDAVAANTASFSYGTATGYGSAVVLTYNGPDQVIASNASVTFPYGTQSVTLWGLSTGGLALTAGAVLPTTGGASTIAANQASATLTITTGASLLTNGVEADVRDYVREGVPATFDAVAEKLDAALSSLRVRAQRFGSQVALLNTRLDFTKAYINTLRGGSGKLRLADINEEGANLLALQTRQQLGIQALSLAGQAEQGILNIFN